MLSRFLLAVVVLFVAEPVASAAVPLHVKFSYEAGAGIPLVTDSLSYQNSVGENFSVTRLDWLATDFSLIDESGKSTVIPDSTVLVKRDGAEFSLTKFRGKKITAISFSIGPDKDTNHSDPAQYHSRHPLNPTVNNLHWSWENGYIFLAIEGHWQRFGQSIAEGFSYHFANDFNRVKVTLPLDLSPSKESRISIALDVKKLFGGLSFARDGATTHSSFGDPVAKQLKDNLQSAFRIVDIHNGSFKSPLDELVLTDDVPTGSTMYPIVIPEYIPKPLLPGDNLITVSRVALGEKLFHEPKLSRNNRITCASCHTGGTRSDTRKLSEGVDGQLGRRHSMPLFNLAWKKRFFWDGRASSLREQVLVPIEDPLEMGESLDNVVRKLKDDSAYAHLFATAFSSGEISSDTVALALEAFLLAQTSFSSKLDLSLYGDYTLSAEERRGFELFSTEYEPRLGKRGADCFHCHGGALFSNHSFNNNGLSTTEDLGLGHTTGLATDNYKFSTPSLRNVALTAPYMHDGRFNTLEEVVEHYNSGVTRTATLDPNIAKHPDGLKLSEADKSALVAFLKTLSDIDMGDAE